VPLEGPAAGVGVEDEEALEDMEERYYRRGDGRGIVGAMRETEGNNVGAQEGRVWV